MGIVLLSYSALWSNLAFPLSNFSAILLIIRPSGFLIIRPYGPVCLKAQGIEYNFEELPTLRIPGMDVKNYPNKLASHL